MALLVDYTSDDPDASDNDVEILETPPSTKDAGTSPAAPSSTPSPSTPAENPNEPDTAATPDHNNEPPPGPTSLETAGDNGIWFEKRLVGKARTPIWSRMKQCDLCHTAIPLGLGKTLRSLEEHRDKSSCKLARKAARANRGQQKLTFFKPRAVASTPPIPSPSKSHGSHSDTAQANSTPPPITVDSDSDEEVEIIPREPADPDTLLGVRKMLRNAGLCPGVVLDVGGDAALRYPHQATTLLSLPIIVELFTTDGQLIVRSKTCLKMLSSKANLPACTSCRDILKDPKVEGVAARAQKEVLPIQTNYQYYNYVQFRSLLGHKTEHDNRLKFQVCWNPANVNIVSN